MVKKVLANNDELTKVLIKELLKEPDVINSLEALKRSIATFMPNIVKKVTEAFMVGLVTAQQEENQKSFDNSSILKTHKERKSKRDWGAASDKALYSAYIYRKKNQIQISDSLSSELASRFPGYDKDGRNFVRGKANFVIIYCKP